jgi:hypothetical protein
VRSAASSRRTPSLRAVRRPTRSRTRVVEVPALLGRVVRLVLEAAGHDGPFPVSLGMFLDSNDTEWSDQRSSTTCSDRLPDLGCPREIVGCDGGEKQALIDRDHPGDGPRGPHRLRGPDDDGPSIQARRHRDRFAPRRRNLREDLGLSEGSSATVGDDDAGQRHRSPDVPRVPVPVVCDERFREGRRDRDPPVWEDLADDRWLRGGCDATHTRTVARPAYLPRISRVARERSEVVGPCVMMSR